MTGRPLRILYVSHSFPLPDQPLSNVGGMQRVAVGLGAALEADPEVELHERVLRTSWKWTGVRTPFFLAGLARSLVDEAREKRIDVVLFSSMVTASVTLRVGDDLRRAGIHTAVIPVGRDVTLPNPVYQRLVPRILRSVDTVFPISRATADTCLVRGANAASLHVVPCGVDLPPLPDAGAQARARSSLLSYLNDLGRPVSDGATLLLSVGRHQERKGFHWFVDQVMPRLSPDFVYLIAGSGPMTPRIAELIRERSLESRVSLLGRVPEAFLQQLYLGSDIFVMPNIPVEGDIEGFGVVMLEAGAVGLPVVAAELEGIRDVVTEGENGVLVPACDAEGFAEAIRTVKTDDALRPKSADHVHRTFGWPAVARQYVALLRSRTGISGTD